MELENKLKYGFKKTKQDSNNRKRKRGSTKRKGQRGDYTKGGKIQILGKNHEMSIGILEDMQNSSTKM